MAAPTTDPSVMLAFPEELEESARRVSTILAGTEPKKVDGHLVVHVPVVRLEDALLISRGDTA